MKKEKFEAGKGRNRPQQVRTKEDLLEKMGPSVAQAVDNHQSTNSRGRSRKEMGESSNVGERKEQQTKAKGQGESFWKMTKKEDDYAIETYLLEKVDTVRESL